jgi:hypothetical protein
MTERGGYANTTKRKPVWPNIRDRIETGRGDHCSICGSLFLDGDLTVGGIAADGAMHYVCSGCVHELRTIDGVGVVSWPVRGRS